MKQNEQLTSQYVEPDKIKFITKQFVDLLREEMRTQRILQDTALYRINEELIDEIVKYGTDK